MRKAVADGVVLPCGQIGHNTIVALTQDDLETLRARLNLSSPPAAV
jgi:hypothetical protein